MSLCDHQYVLCQILVDDEPGRVVRTASTANAQTLALPKRVIHQTLVVAQVSSLRRLHATGIGRQIAAEKALKAALSYETDSGTVLLVVNLETRLLRQLPHATLRDIPDWKAAGSELTLTQHIEEVGLILVLIQCPVELDAFAIDPDTRIVTCGNTSCA